MSKLHSHILIICMGIFATLFQVTVWVPVVSLAFKVGARGFSEFLFGYCKVILMVPHT